MLKSLQVKNYVLMDSLEVEFPEGLVIISGQTGAGKSILLGALSLVLGAKADVSLIGEAGNSCVVEACFGIEGNDRAKAVISGFGLNCEGNELVVRRVLNRTGRSRSFVNDEPASLAALNELSPCLLDIHSQHDTLLLRDKAFQLSMLDAFAGNRALLKDCSAAWERVCVLRSRLARAQESLEKVRRERDYNQALLDKLDSAKLREGEFAELEEEHKRLSGAEEIKSGLFQVREILDSGRGEGTSVSAMLREASRILSKLGKYLTSAGELSARLDSSRIEIEDILDETANLEAGVDLSGERLVAVEERLSLLLSLMKKHSCTSDSELIAVRDGLLSGLEYIGTLEEEIVSLSGELELREKEYDTLAKRLHDVREASVGEFSFRMLELLSSLEMERAVFETELVSVPASATGTDSITLGFSATGGTPVDVAKCASGGEMSRIMLCMKAMMAGYSHMPTLFFDEIDSGVSGSTADSMGNMICSMGMHMQVFAITHLPQVAAKGSAHYLVSKIVGEGGARSEIKKITGEERISEIARMLSGAAITPQAIANAKSLLGIRAATPR